MSKILASWLVMVLGGWLVLYLAAAFSFLSFNPADWGFYVRAGYAGASVLWLAGMSYLTSVAETDSAE